MSHQLISRNTDLKKLRDEGYDVKTVANYLVVSRVPYVNSERKIKFGTLVSELTLSGDITVRPSSHTVSFIGEHPCDANGSPLNIVNQSQERSLADNIVVQFSFSMKLLENGKKRDYLDYFEKMTTYIDLIGAPARVLSPKVTAKTFAAIELDEASSIFNYFDTASSRSEIVESMKKLELHKIAIIGLGGTGSYILDFVAKTPVKEIHLFDSDLYFSHNAFRSPGAPSLQALRDQPKKVNYYKSIYEKMHRGIVAHDYDIDGTNIEELKDADFVFISIHGGEIKRLIFQKLEEFGLPFVDVGMGLFLLSESCSIGGVLRVTASTIYKREHTDEKVSFSDSEDANNDYSTNIQVADLNAFNAILAVIKWKKIFGFYLDLEKEHNSVYTIDGNVISNGEKS